MKIRNAFLAVVLVIVLMTASACSLYNDSNSVKLNLNGGTVESNLTSYTPGEEITLPVPEREHYTFDGWYTSADFDGEAVEKISETATGKQSFWAKWIPDVYTVTLNVNGGTVVGSLTEYTYGVGATLPSATKNGYNFMGWVDSQTQSVTEISETDFGNKEYWAQWSGATYNLTLNLNGGSLSNAPTSYIYGNETPLPEPTMSGFDFWGWYESSNFSGNAVEKISATDEPGDRVFYAKWEPEAEINVTAWGGYDEGAYLKFELLDNVATSAYKVEYSIAGRDSYTQIDSELIRCDVADGTGRADVVGITSGTYDVRLSAGNKSVVKNNIEVSAYDRSGYAHFDSSSSNSVYSAGVGGYTNSGTPKANAQIIYVSEATKNSVKATIGGTSYTGLVAILRALPSANTPVIIRILDTIKAATWNAITYSQSTVDPDYVIANTPSTKGNTLQKQKYSMQELIDGGFNTLNTDPANGGCSALDGLYDRNGNTYYGGYLNYDSSKSEFDSCWNNCTIGTSSSSGKFAKNVTVEGIGTGAGLFQWGITWKYAESVEVRNLTFDDYNEDACSFEGSTDSTTFDGFDSNRIWLHHCTFEEGKNYWDVCNEQDKGDGDGSTDFKKCAYVTIAYNHYIDTHKTGLIGGSGSHKTASVTFHHNYYRHCKSRLPLGRQANMHMYNNYYENTTDTCLSLRAGAYALVEYCYFSNASNPIVSVSESGLNGAAKVFNCTFNGVSLVEGTYIKKVTDRTTAVTNQNIYDQNFDTNPSVFYYDATNKRSNVTNLITDLNTIPTLIPQLAGVLKAGK